MPPRPTMLDPKTGRLIDLVPRPRGRAAPPVILTGTVASADGTITAQVEVVQTGEPPPAKLPDLTVVSCWVEEPQTAEPYPDAAPLLMAARVRNDGERILPGVIIGVAFGFGSPDDEGLLPTHTWSDSYLDGLGTGEEIDLVANGGFTSSTFPACGPRLAVEARVDDPTDVSRILEANENNNRLRVEFAVDTPDPGNGGPPPTSGSPASAQLTVGDYPTDGPEAPEWLAGFMAPLQNDGQRKAPGAAQNLGGNDHHEFTSRCWGIASNDPVWGQDWLRRGQRISITIPTAFPPPGTPYYAVTDAQKRQALLDSAAGANDAVFRAGVAEFFKAHPNPGPLIDSRVSHEPDATWYVWSIAGGLDAYHACNHHVMPLWRDLLPGTRMVFNMNGATDKNMAWSPVPYGTGQSQTELIFGPLREYATHVAADVYYGGDKASSFANVERMMRFLRAWSDDWQMPCMVPEWGLDSVDWPDAIEHWRSLVEEFADGQFLYHVYFDGWEPAALRNKPQARERFYSLSGFGT